jgi:hypothetical protein
VTNRSGDGDQGTSVSRLSDEAASRLNLRARSGMQTISDAFKDYGEKLGAPEWGSYDYGETARFVEFFLPAAKDLVEAHLQEYSHPPADTWPVIIDAVLRRIKIAASEEPPLPKMVHTHPWRPSELFGRQEFLEAMRAMIRSQLPQRGVESPLVSLASTPEASDPLADAGRIQLSESACPEPLRASIATHISAEAVKVAQKPVTDPNGDEGLPATQGQGDLDQEPFQPTRASHGATSPGNRAERLFRKEGESWRLVFDGSEVYVNHRKGLGYIADLLRSPDKPFYCAELLAAGHGGPLPTLGAAGDSLDHKAFENYRLRVEALDDQIAEADRNNDEGRKQLLQVELDQISDELQRATGLGGRHRTAHEDAEKIRKGVCNAITRAIDALRPHHRELAEHLKAHIELGSFITYKTDGPPWQF